MIQVSLQNVLNNHGIAITITGMVIVFSGLVLISLFITQLPNLLRIYDRLRARKNQGTNPVSKADLNAEAALDAAAQEDEIMAAISLVIHLELERLTGESQKITISRRPGQGSIWASAGKMRSLSQWSTHA
jgi:Na+-transporting methylmalonyl-CoA/oxaloacetate decarboxylase gamma subunit